MQTQTKPPHTQEQIDAALIRALQRLAARGREVQQERERQKTNAEGKRDGG